MRVKLTNVRIAFAHLFKPQKFDENSTPKFSIRAIIEPDSDNENLILDAIETEAEEKFGKQWERILDKIDGTDKCCYVQDEYADQDGEPYDGFADMHYLRASNEVQPKLRDRDLSPLTIADGKPYSGCYCTLIVDIWAFKHVKGGNQVNCTLGAVQFVKDGEGFGRGAPISDDELDDLSIDDDSDDDSDDDDNGTRRRRGSKTRRAKAKDDDSDDDSSARSSSRRRGRSSAVKSDLKKYV